MTLDNAYDLYSSLRPTFVVRQDRHPDRAYLREAAKKVVFLVARPLSSFFLVARPLDRLGLYK